MLELHRILNISDNFIGKAIIHTHIDHFSQANLVNFNKKIDRKITVEESIDKFKSIIGDNKGNAGIKKDVLKKYYI